MQEEPTRCGVAIICKSLKLSQVLESGSNPRQTAGWIPVKQWDELGMCFGVLLTFSRLNHLPDFMSAGSAFPRSLIVAGRGILLLLCTIFIPFNILPHHLGIWWYVAYSGYGVFGFFLHLTCCKQFLGNQGVFCHVVDYTIDFSEPNICRVTSSCDTIAEMKKWKWAHLVLFSCVCCLLLYTEYFISVFYSCLFFFFHSCL